MTKPLQSQLKTWKLLSSSWNQLLLSINIPFLYTDFVKESTAQRMKFSIKGFFSKCEKIHSFLRIWSHLLKKSLMENFIFLCSEDASGCLSVMSSRDLDIPEIARKKFLKISHAQAIFFAQVLIIMFFFSWHLCSTMFSESLNKMNKSEEKNGFYYNTL